MKPAMAAGAKGAAVLLLSLGVLTGCGGIPYLNSGSSAASTDRYEFRVGEGSSRVFFFNESDFPFAAYVDGIAIGSVSGRGEYLRAEIPAGTHVVQWKDLAGGPDRLQGETQVAMASGQPYLFRVSRNTGRIENLGRAGGAELSERTLVLADPKVTSQIPRPAAASTGKSDTPTPRAKTLATDPPPSPSPATKTMKEKLSELKDLYDSGLITKDEYDGKRKQLLEKWN